MCGGGGTSTTTQQTTIPPEVLARYNKVNEYAENLYNKEFQKYGTKPEDFVAQLTPEQQQAIKSTGQYANAAQGSYQSAQNQLNDAQSAGSAALSGAYTPLQQGQQQGAATTNQALQGYQNLPGQYQGSFDQANNTLNQGLSAGQAGLGAAQNYVGQGAQAVNAQQFSPNAVNQYMNPYVSNVVEQTMAAQAQQNAQQRNALRGDAIKSGAFGGDRAGIAQANLAYQQNLANNQTIANLYNQGYGQALQTFQQQQGVNLAADQANRAALANAGNQMANIANQNYAMGSGAAQIQSNLGSTLAGLYGQQAQGLAGIGQQQFNQGLAASQQYGNLANQQYQMGANTAMNTANLGQGAQNAGLQGAQALMGMGQIQQQTDQAGKTALYNQFLQEQSYPFQVVQFLANIAMGTGALSGSTTTTTQPSSIFSDERLKENIEPIGETYDGQGIYKYNYKGDNAKQIGLVAQDVERHHPEAVGLAAGFKTVDYDAATERAAQIAHRAQGLIGRQHKSVGGGSVFDPDFIKQLLANQAGMYSGMYGQPGTPRGGKGLPGAGESGRVPAASLPVGKLVTHSAPPRQSSGMDDIKQAVGLGETAAKIAGAGKSLYKEYLAPKEAPKGGVAAPNAAPGAAATPAKEGVNPATGKVTEAGDKLGVVPPKIETASADLQNLSNSVSGVVPQDLASADSVANPAAVEQAAGLLGGTEVADATEALADEDVLESLGSLFAARGGRINKAGGGSTSDDDSDPDIGAPEGMYKPVSGGIDIPNETRKNELMKPDKPPKAPDSGFGDVLDAAKAAASIAASMVSIFSDERVKENAKKIGKLDDGQDVYKYNYKGSPKTQIGLMAQDVEKHEPDAVTDLGGVKMVDYDKATKKAERRKRAGGGTDDVKEGLVPLTGEVLSPEPKEEEKGVGRVQLAALNRSQNDGTTPTGVAPAPKEETPFDRSVKRTFEFEGGLNPRDTNGTPSKYGINAMANPDVDLDSLTPEKARQIYKTRYWDAIGADNMDPKLAHVAYDTAVLAGPAKAKQMVAQAEGDPMKLMQIRQTYLNNLAENDPEKYGKYVTAWNKRNATLINDITEGTVRAAAVPGTAGSGRGSVDVAASPYASIMKGILPDSTSQKATDILTSENFWVPLLAGVGSMLASPSIKLPGAIGSGLVGGTAAYTGLKGLQANVANTEANTERTYADIVKDSVFTDGSGGRWFRYLLPSGGYGLMSIAEWLELPDNAKPKLDPRIEKVVLEEADRLRTKREGEAKTKTNTPGSGGVSPAGRVESAPISSPAAPTRGTATEPSTTETTTAPSSQPSTTPDTPQPIIALPSKLQEKYRKMGKELMAGGDQMAGQQPDVYTPQMKVAQGANNQRPQLTELATSMAALPRDKSILASGSPQKVLQPVAAYLNGWAGVLGIPPVIDPKDLGNSEAVNKAVNQLKTAAAKEGGQTAFSALSEFGSTLPSNLNTPGAQAKLLAQIYYTNQREIDKNEFFNQALKAAKGEKGQFAQYAMRSGFEADKDFNDTYSQAFYAKEIQALERMFNEGPKGMKDDKGRPISWMEFLNKEGATLSSKERRQIENQFGRGILRYFGVQQ